MRQAADRINPITKGEWNVREVLEVDEDETASLLLKVGRHARIRSLSRALRPGELRRQRLHPPHRRATATTASSSRRTANGSISPPGRASTSRRSSSSAAPRTASSSPNSNAPTTALLTAKRLEPPGALRRQRPRRQDRHPRHHHPPAGFRSRRKVSGGRGHLRRPARPLRAQVLLHLVRQQRDGRTRLHRREDRRHGHQLAQQGVPRRLLEKPDGLRLPRPHRVDQGRRRHPPVDGPRHASASTAAAPAARARSPACSTTAISTRSAWPTAAATTTAWTRSGGTRHGWAGRSMKATPTIPTSPTPRKLSGKLMLVVGELDNNVDPASTYQVVAALQKAGQLVRFRAGHQRRPRRRGNPLRQIPPGGVSRQAAPAVTMRSA